MCSLSPGTGRNCLTMAIKLYSFIKFHVLKLELSVSSFNQHARYYYNYLVYLICTSIFGIICLPLLFFIKHRHVDNIKHGSALLKHTTKLLGVSWHLRNGEILAEERGCVIVANHQSCLDVLGMFHIWGTMGKCAPVARKEILYMFPFGPLAWLGGVVFIDRSRPNKAKYQMKPAVDLVQNEKTKLWMFPEGTRNDNGSMLDFKKGAFRIAITCQVPIIPVVYSPYSFIDHKKRLFRKGSIVMTALNPIPTIGLTLDDVDELVDKTRNAMLQTYRSLRLEMVKEC